MHREWWRRWYPEPLIKALPNLISLLRLALVPVILRLIWNRQYEWALVWSLVAGVSDGADGFLARRLRATSRTGAYIDPLADKLLLSGTYLTGGLDGIIPIWLTAIVFGRDLLMGLALGYAFLFTRLRNFPPTIWGKISTAIQIATALVVLLSHSPRWIEFPRNLDQPMFYATAAATIWSAIHYTWIGVRLLQADRHTGTARMSH